jgi:hypothetical protein
VCPCVAAGAALESAVFQSASCVLCVRGARDCAQKRKKAGPYVPTPPIKKEMFGNVCIRLYARDDFFYGSNTGLQQEARSLKQSLCVVRDGLQVTAARVVGLRGHQIPIFPLCEMGDARPGALEPLCRAVIKSWGLRGSKNEVQMRGGFEAWAAVPGGGGVWGGVGRGAWNTPQIYPGLGLRLQPGCGWRGTGAWGHAGKGRAAGGAAGAGGVCTPGHRAPANAPRSLALDSAVYKFGFFFFFSLLVPEQSSSDLTTGRLERGDGKQKTVVWGGVGQELKCTI